MAINQIFCSHRHLTAIDMYIHISPYYTTSDDEIIVKLKCDKCKKELEMYLENMQLDRHEFRIDVDTTNLEKYEQFGGTKKVKYEVENDTE